MGQVFEDMNKALNQAIDYEKGEAKIYKIAFIRQGTNYVEIFGKVKTTLKELERAKNWFRDNPTSTNVAFMDFFPTESILEEYRGDEYMKMILDSNFEAKTVKKLPDEYKKVDYEIYVTFAQR